MYLIWEDNISKRHLSLSGTRYLEAASLYPIIHMSLAHAGHANCDYARIYDDASVANPDAMAH